MLKVAFFAAMLLAAQTDAVELAPAGVKNLAQIEAELESDAVAYLDVKSTSAVTPA